MHCDRMPRSRKGAQEKTMKASLILAASLGLGLAFASNADAQYRKNETVVISLKVDSWTPHEGEAGTLVTLSGSGFTRKTQILVGGRKVNPAQVGSRSLSFRVPTSYGNGEILLRSAGVANDYIVGTFNVWANPKVSGFSPASGTPGTKVEIRGQDFSQDDMVYLGSQNLPVERWASGSLIVTIPQGAASAYLSVKNKRNVEARSPRSFTVVAPAPYITSFSPLRGQPGSVVRITGGNYGDDIRVAYGRQNVAVTRTGNDWIEITIPSNADKGWPINISSRRGNASSSTAFDLELPPQLSSYAPAYGHVGSQITLRGQHFLAEDRVSLGGQNCKIVDLRDNLIVVEVPGNAHNGPLAVHRGAQSVALANDFDVLYPPVLSGIAPLQGAPGTQVVLSGQHLDDAKVYLGNTEIRASGYRDGQLTVVIPERAISGAWRVTTRGGEGAWAKPFEVWNYPNIRKLSPVRGPVGSALTISGTMLGNATNIYLGDKEMPIIKREGDDTLIVQVPQGARDGAIAYSSYGQKTLSNWRYDVLQAPVLTSYSPTEGPWGTRVSIAGSGFDGDCQVLYGDKPARVLGWTANNISVEIPRGVDKSDYLVVRGPGGDARAANPWGLLNPPTLRKYSTYAAKPGSELTLWGEGLASDTIVGFGTSNSKVLRVNPDNSVVVVVPALAAGPYQLSVQNRGLRAEGRQRFSVLGFGEVTGISAKSAKVGDTIMLTGSGLESAQIWFGSYQLPVQRADRRGRKLWVSIPEGCSGTGGLTVVDGSNKSQSTVQLSIEAPKPPTVRDHRTEDKGDDKNKGKGPKVRDHRRGR